MREHRGEILTGKRFATNLNTMPNRNTDELFQLIKSLEKGEKRNFKLFAKRNSASGEMKITLLFDALDKMKDYDEVLLLKKNKGIRKQQLSNLKAHLYKQILSSLRVMKDENNIDIRLHEQMDHARILFNKGLYLHTLKLLEKIKEQSKTHHQLTFWLQALIFEKKIESLYITRSMANRAESLAMEVDDLNKRLLMIGQLSNLSLELYSWYIRYGHARNAKDEEAVKSFLKDHLPAEAERQKGFYERLYFYQCLCWHSYILQHFLQHYRYSQKWVDLFDAEPAMRKVEELYYLKGLHNLASAHFMLRNAEKHTECLARLEQVNRQKGLTDNSRIQAFVYLYSAKINQHFMEGSFTQGLRMIPLLEEKLEEYELKLDRHRILVFYYKIACLYFGSGNNGRAIDYLNKVIQWKIDLRTDLQCYARLLHLIAHYESGNDSILEYLIKSVYRFMAKMENLGTIEEEVFRFLRRSFHLSPQKIKPGFEQLLARLRRHEHRRFEARATMYLDIISWLESKIAGVPVQEVIRRKFEQQKRNGG
jgi:hypothetical protein